MLSRLKNADRAGRGWPGYVFGGRMRTSTLVLVIAFIAVWWVYDDHREDTESTPTQVPATQVVPPGFVPDPNYTWVPRTRVQPPPTTTPKTSTPTPTPTPTTTTAPPLVPPLPPLPTLPTVVLPPPFGPPATTASPPPGVAPAPPNAPLPLP